eukprot:gene4158-8264_t
MKEMTCFSKSCLAIIIISLIFESLTDAYQNPDLSEIINNFRWKLEFDKNLSANFPVFNILENIICKKKDLHLGCCHRVIHLHDVMIVDGSFIVFEETPGKMSFLKERGSTYFLPPLVHRYSGSILTSQIPVEKKNQTLPLHSCKGFFNGTLHVSGRKTAHKLFHMLNDNMLPLMTQIILDLFLAPEYAHLPHMSLSNEKHHVKTNRYRRKPFRAGRYPDNLLAPTKIPHAILYKKLFEGGELDMESANGMCFRRVAWGSGLRIHYTDAMVVLRRLTADFARLLAMMTYNPPVPQPFIYEVKREKKTSHRPLQSRDGRSLRIVYLSRGAWGSGRSLADPSIIINRLSERGASVLLCGHAHSNITAQLSCVAHADVIIGLHGAALVNAIFAPRGCILVELKTLYGYTTDIFTRTADSREGMYIHIDIRQYSSPHGFHKADSILAGMIEGALVKALALKKSNKQGGGRIRRLTASNNYLIEPSLTSGELGHVLGPSLKSLNYTCKRVLSYAFYRQVVLKGDKMEHCSQCHKEWERIF